MYHGSRRLGGQGDGRRAGPSVDISKLDAGPYPTEPSQPLGVTGDPLRGVLVEAQRMANNVVGPWEVDSTLTKWFGFGATVLQNAGDLAQLGPEPFAAAAGQHGFVNGFVSARTAEGQKILLNAVLRFPDPGAATAAATEFGDIAAKTGERCAARADAGPPGHARRRAIRQTEGATGKRWGAVRAFTPHGQYVFMQLAQAIDGTDPALGLVAKTVDLQGPVIDKFRATDLSEFGDISLDPTGLLARTLPVPDKEATTIQDTTYEQRGALHFQNDPARSATLFSETGTDLVAMAKTNVYQTKDSESAARRSSKGSSPNCSRHRSRPSRSTTCRTAAACNWRTRASTASVRPTATQSKRPRTSCWMPSSRWPPSTRCWSSS